MPNFWWLLSRSPRRGDVPRVAVPRDAGEAAIRRGRRLTQLARIAVTELKGIGQARAKRLSEMGIDVVLDLLLHYPFRWADRSHPMLIADAVLGEEALFDATVAAVRSRRTRSHRSIVEVDIVDESGKVTLTFFNQPYRKDQLTVDMQVVVFGKVDIYGAKRQMTNPIVDFVGDQTGAIIPIYRQSAKAGVTSRDLHRYIGEALDRAGAFEDLLDPSVRDELHLVDRTTAFNNIHRPERMDQRYSARRRLAFDELWRLQLALVMRKRAQAASARGIAHRIAADGGEVDLVSAFISRLPYALTGAQRRVLNEIADDLASDLPMHRLLQGDVGSGKTVVALATMLYGVQGGYQCALMVPTEVLAEQHFAVASQLLADLVVPDGERITGEREVRIELLSAATTAKDRAVILRGLREGTIDIVVGTHALLTEDVVFRSLGIVVIDEQHRFGVDQRATLREKGSIDQDNQRDPDLLVMTATPIPRTAAMTVYGDLDYSEIDELPAGRDPISTTWVDDASLEPEVWTAVREHIHRGSQAFVVCPRVKKDDGGDEIDESGLVYVVEDSAEDNRLFRVSSEKPSARPLRSVVDELERLSSGPLDGLRVAMLHGQMATKEKERVMGAFRRGELDVLVATTVVEVGVDIPKATVIVIEDADRFGIAQLHQLRGRVGRGGGASSCILLAYDVTDDARRRLEAMTESTNGFVLAEIDLDLRGEGTVLGARQKGRNDLKLASLRNDRELVALARSVAIETIDSDPDLVRHRDLLAELELFVGEGEAQYLERS